MSLNKYIKTIAFLLISFIANAESETHFNSESTFNEANQLYQEEKYSDALLEYEKLIKKLEKSENLYYNIANAYYKTGQLGKSILYYEKTLKINPNNKNAIHNLRLANSKIQEGLDVLPDLFFIVWWKQLLHLFSANTWAWIAIAFSWFSVIAFAFFLFSKNLLLKKSAFFKIFLFGFIGILSMIIAGINSEKIFKKEEIILVNTSSYGKDAPSTNGANQEIFHEGTKLEVIDKVNNYFKVKTSEGNTVWVNSEDFMLI